MVKTGNWNSAQGKHPDSLHTFELAPWGFPAWKHKASDWKFWFACMQEHET